MIKKQLVCYLMYNNGSIGVSDITVNGGQIENLYVRGESGRDGVPGIVETVKVQVLGRTATNLLPGNNNNIEIKDNKFITPNSDVTIQAEFETIKVDGNETIDNVTNSETNDSIILMIILTILSISSITGVAYKLKQNC